MLEVNNDLYDQLGERWYEAHDDPVALLRAESRLRNPWILEKIRARFPSGMQKVLDIGCGGGFLSNYLAAHGLQVTGVDLSEESLAVAQKYDTSKSVVYSTANAEALPFESSSFDVVCAMDFLEHVDRPQIVVAEAARVLRPGGLFFFHTFNRNLLSWLVVIKAVEMLVANTPPRMHVLKYFIKPQELAQFCEDSGLEVQEMLGLQPNLLRRDLLPALISGKVPKDFSFRFSSSLMTSYSGFALKRSN